MQKSLEPSINLAVTIIPNADIHTVNQFHCILYFFKFLQGVCLLKKPNTNILDDVIQQTSSLPKTSFTAIFFFKFTFGLLRDLRAYSFCLIPRHCAACIVSKMELKSRIQTRFPVFLAIIVSMSIDTSAKVHHPTAVLSFVVF